MMMMMTMMMSVDEFRGFENETLVMTSVHTGVCKSKSFKQLFPKKLVTVLPRLFEIASCQLRFETRWQSTASLNHEIPVFAATPERQRGSDVGEVTVSSLTRSLLPVWHDYVLFIFICSRTGNLELKTDELKKKKKKQNYGLTSASASISDSGQHPAGICVCHLSVLIKRYHYLRCHVASFV